MKCPVCSKGKIVGRAYTIPIYTMDGPRTIFEADSPDAYETKYRPYCTECNTVFFPVKTFETPEAAIEAMRPKVSEELVEFILNIIGSKETLSYMNEYDNDGAYRAKKIKSFVKQELEKFYAKD
jgi:hypothetical protein